MTRKKIKFKNKVLKHEQTIDLKGNKYVPTKLSFNFSFLTNDKKYNFNYLSKELKAKLVDKIQFLSSDDFVVVSNWDKNQGLEQIAENQINISIHPEFISSGRDELCGEKFWIFRLSSKGRVIGKLKDKTFFILSVDTSFDQYNH